MHNYLSSLQVKDEVGTGYEKHCILSASPCVNRAVQRPHDRFNHILQTTVLGYDRIDCDRQMSGQNRPCCINDCGWAKCYYYLSSRLHAVVLSTK